MPPTSFFLFKGISHTFEGFLQNFRVTWTIEPYIRVKCFEHTTEGQRDSPRSGSWNTMENRMELYGLQGNHNVREMHFYKKNFTITKNSWSCWLTFCNVSIPSEQLLLSLKTSKKSGFSTWLTYTGMRSPIDTGMNLMLKQSDVQDLRFSKDI